MSIITLCIEFSISSMFWVVAFLSAFVIELKNFISIVVCNLMIQCNIFWGNCMCIDMQVVVGCFCWFNFGIKTLWFRIITGNELDNWRCKTEFALFLSSVTISKQQTNSDSSHCENQKMHIGFNVCLSYILRSYQNAHKTHVLDMTFRKFKIIRLHTVRVA